MFSIHIFIVLCLYSRIVEGVFKVNSSIETTTTSCESRYNDDNIKNSITNSCGDGDCYKTDVYNTLWCGKSNYTSFKLCRGNSSGTSFWKCSGTEFIGSQPDFTNCRSNWLIEMEKRIEQDQHIASEEVQNYFKIINGRCAAENNPTIKDPQYFSHEIKRIFELAGEMLERFDPETEFNVFEKSSNSGIDVMGNVLLNDKPWDLILDKKPCSEASTAFILAAEKAVLELTRRMAYNNTWMSEHIKYLNRYNRQELNVTSGAQVIKYTENDTLCFPQICNEVESYIRLPKNWAKNFPASEDLQFVGLQICNTFTNKFFPGKLSSIQNQGIPIFVNSKLLSLTLNSTLAEKNSTSTTSFPGEGISIKFKHHVHAWGSRSRIIRRDLKPNETPKAVLGSARCVYWDTSLMEWSTEGCQLISSSHDYTVCKCQHLSSFALLMDMHQYVGRSRTLEILTLVLSPLSILCLSACILIISTTPSLRSIRSPRNEITQHLCINLLIGNLVLILFMDKGYFNLNSVMCTIAGTAIHFHLLTAFCWMTIEAVQLYRMVIVVFHDGYEHKLTHMVFAYGMSALVVIITALTGLIKSEFVYNGVEFCWLQDDYIWAFMGPVAVLITVNILILVFCLVHVHIISRVAKFQGANQTDRSISKLVKGSISLTVLLGLCWVFGYLMLMSPCAVTSQISAILFTILNSSQGILLFIFHFVMNKDVKLAIKRKIEKYRPSGIISIPRRTDSASTLQETCSDYSEEKSPTKDAQFYI